MARRKSLWDKYFDTLEEAVQWIKQIKEINGNSIQVEMQETTLGFTDKPIWWIHVWWLK